MNVFKTLFKYLTGQAFTLYMDGGGGGGGGSPVQQQTAIQELPEWAKPYAQQTLARGAALTDINQNPYQTYQNNRIAGFSPLQQQAQQQAAGMTTAPQLSQATSMATQAGLQGLGAAYQPGQFGNQFQAPGQYQTGQFNAMQAQAPALQQYQMGPAQQVGTQDYTGANVSQYMSPYMQNVVDIQKREAQRASDIAGTQQAGQAVKMGAFGGSRAGLLEAERQRNLATQMGDIQATGQQAAFQNAQQQFNQQQQANLQAALANQQAGLTTGQQNLAAQLGVQQLGAGQNLQAQLANQQAGLQTQQLGEQSRQFGAGQGMTAAQQRAQYGLSGQQLGEQSRQYGAGLGMQGANLGLQAANALGGLGQNQYQQTMGINQLQNQYGAQQQALQQQGLTQAYQDFLNQQNYPYRQLGFMSDLIRGMPLGQQSTASIYQPTTALQNMAGLGLGAYGLKQLGMFAEGGKVDGYADGGMTVMDKFNDPEAMLADMDKMTEAQLQAIIKAPTTPAEREAAQRELAMRASERQGLAGAFNQIPQQQQQAMVRAAGGGIIAFAQPTSANNYSLVSSEDDGEDEEERAAQRGLSTRIIDPVMQDKLNRSGLSIVDYLMKPSAYTAPTAAERLKYMKDYTTEMKEAAGESPSAGMRAYLQEQRDALGKEREEAKGLAALQAIPAVMQPGGFLRGAGAGLASFGGAMGELAKAQRTAKNQFAQMEFNLNDADRKERMGLHRDARAAFDASEQNKIAGIKADREAKAAAGNIVGKLAQANKITGSAGTGAPKPPKLPERLYDDNLAHLMATEKPNAGETQAQFASRMRKEAGALTASQVKTTDIGPTKAGIATDTLTANLREKAGKEWSGMSRAAQRKWARDMGVDMLEAKDKFISAYKEDAAPTTVRPPVNRNSTTPPSSGTVEGMPPGSKLGKTTPKGVEVFDSSGKLIGYAQ